MGLRDWFRRVPNTEEPVSDERPWDWRETDPEKMSDWEWEHGGTPVEAVFGRAYGDPERERQMEEKYGSRWLEWRAKWERIQKARSSGGR